MLSHSLKGFYLIIIASSILLICACSKSGGPDNPVTPPPPETPKKWTVSTVAGNGDDGLLDGPDSASSFKSPLFLCVAASGDIYVDDFLNKFIRKISNHQVTHFGGFTGDYATSFTPVNGVAIDQQNNLYDVESGYIRKTTSAGVYSFLAGSGTHEIKDGQDTAARFNEIAHIVLANDNNLYLSDLDFNYNTVIRKVTLSGMVSTVTLKDNTGVGSGSVNGQPVYPAPIAVDKAGNIYFTANSGSLIKKADPNGNVSIFAGSVEQGSSDGKGAAAQFNTITSMVVAPDGNIYLVDMLGNKIRQVAPDGTVQTINTTVGIGYVDGDATVARFKSPYGIAVDANGVLYIADKGNSRIRKMVATQ